MVLSDWLQICLIQVFMLSTMVLMAFSYICFLLFILLFVTDVTII
jgi:hypothetical protein